jgi:hypothetical protein
MVNYRKLFIGIFYGVLFILFLFILSKPLNNLIGYIDVVKSATGGSANIYVGLILVLILPFWILEMIRGNLQKVFGYFILMLPFTARASRLIGINAHQSDYWIQRISVTTFLLFLLLFKICSSEKRKAVSSI